MDLKIDGRTIAEDPEDKLRDLPYLLGAAQAATVSGVPLKFAKDGDGYRVTATVTVEFSGVDKRIESAFPYLTGDMG